MKYLDKENIPKYDKKIAMAYADESKSMKWCPAPNCDYGCEVESISATTVKCPCGWVYCFKCG